MTKNVRSIKNREHIDLLNSYFIINDLVIKVSKKVKNDPNIHIIYNAKVESILSNKENEINVFIFKHKRK